MLYCCNYSNKHYLPHIIHYQCKLLVRLLAKSCLRKCVLWPTSAFESVGLCLCVWWYHIIFHMQIHIYSNVCWIYAYILVCVLGLSLFMNNNFAKNLYELYPVTVSCANSFFLSRDSKKACFGHEIINFWKARELLMREVWTNERFCRCFSFFNSYVMRHVSWATNTEQVSSV